MFLLKVSFYIFPKNLKSGDTNKTWQNFDFNNPNFRDDHVGPTTFMLRNCVTFFNIYLLHSNCTQWWEKPTYLMFNLCQLFLELYIYHLLNLKCQKKVDAVYGVIHKNC